MPEPTPAPANPSSAERVVVLGASDNPSRFSHRAMRLLETHGHTVVPVHPSLRSIEGRPVVHALGEVEGTVDTVTVYLRPTSSAALGPSFTALAPRRVIFNPGAENSALAADLARAGIDVQNACTLVLLRSGQF